MSFNVHDVSNTACIDRTIIEMLLDSLPALSAENQNVEAAIGGPLRAAVSALVRPPFLPETSL